MHVNIRKKLKLKIHILKNKIEILIKIMLKWIKTRTNNSFYVTINDILLITFMY